MNGSDANRPTTGFWVVAVLSLLWNGFGGYDYVMSQTHNAEYLAQFPPEAVPWMDSFPVWAVALWAIGVWGAVAGSILLLMRSRHAVTAFLVSLAGAVLSMAYQYMMSGMPDSLKSPMMTGFSLVIIAVAALLWWYARRAQGRGVLA